MLIPLGLIGVVLIYLWLFNRTVDRLIALKRAHRASDEAIDDLRDLVFSLRFRSLYR